MVQHQIWASRRINEFKEISLEGKKEKKMEKEQQNLKDQ